MGLNFGFLSFLIHPTPKRSFKFIQILDVVNIPITYNQSWNTLVVPFIELVVESYMPQDSDTIYSVIPVLDKTRWISPTTSGAYFNTGINKTSSMVVVEQATVRFNSRGERRLSGISPNAGGYWGVTSGNSFEMHGSEPETYASQPDITKKTFIQKTYNDTRDTGYLYLFQLNGYNTGWQGRYIADTKIYVDNVLVKYYIPIIKNGNAEFVDLLTGNTASRIGSFQISLT